MLGIPPHRPRQLPYRCVTHLAVGIADYGLSWLALDMPEVAERGPGGAKDQD